VNAKRLQSVIVAFCLLISIPSQAEPPSTEKDLLPVYESGVATLKLGTRQVPIGYAVTPLGPVFSLHAIVANLGGELKLGPMNQSHELTLGTTKFTFGPGSAVVTEGTEIYPIVQRPRPAEDGLKVPLDLLETVYGEQMSYDFQWDAATRTLSIEKLPARTIQAEIDLVHVQGVTTVVLQFSTRPRYRIRRTSGQVAVEFIGDRLETRPTRSTHSDQLVRQILQTPQSIRLVLSPDAEANDYTLLDPFRLVFDIYKTTVTAAPPPVPTTPLTRTRAIQTIVIDPGHGGSDTGAVGSKGVEEKTITLLLAQVLRSRLEERLPVRVVLTRTDDAELPLDTRTALANQQKADLFISLHINSVHGSSARGAETYFSSLQASDENAARSAATENLSNGANDGEGEDALYDLQLILWDLAQSHYLAESQRLAALVQEEFNEALGLRDRGVKQAPFRVLLGAAMPAVLVECGFISNPEEEERLLDPAYRADLVNSLVRAVTRYRAQREGLDLPPDEATP
jgi:N-acetylmuramoyl-L-alanine amidase